MSKGPALAKLTIILSVILVCAACGEEPGLPYCSIHVVDAETGRGIPAIRLQSLNKASYITDSHGYIAYYEPGLMGEQVYFEIDAEGYRTELDITGRQAVSLQTDEGGEVEITLRRTQAAERLYRLTGQGIYRESLLLGKPVPVKHPAINAGVLGQDSNLGVEYRSRIFWVWGDSFLPGQYDGNFAVSAATSELPGQGGLDPDIGVDFNYFTDANGHTRPMIQLEGQGYTWFEWLINLPDDRGEERMVAKYARIGGLWQNYERGIAVFNDSLGLFMKHSDSPRWLKGFAVMQHPFFAVADTDTFIYSSAEFDYTRVAPSLDSLAAPEAYKTFTCLISGSDYSAIEPELERDEAGRLVYDWKPGTASVDAARQAELIAAGKISPEEGWIQLRDMITHHQHRVRRGSINWNEYRQKWVLIAQGDGDYLGDVIYSEADSPVGPWAYATVVAKHDNLFYNPVHHAFFDNGPLIYFEGTYTNFWGQGTTKPWYDYNQLQYRLNLGSQGAMLPSPVYRMTNNDLAFAREIRESGDWTNVSAVAFYAFEPGHRPADAIPYFKSFDGEVSLSETGEGEPFMYALGPVLDMEAKIRGRWDCQIKSFEAIDAFLPMAVSGAGSEWDISTTSRSMEVANVQYSDDRLSFEVLQYGNRYRLNCNVRDIANGKIIGTWQKLRADGSTSPEFLWEGEKIDPGWLPALSGTQIGIDVRGRITADIALCRVWPNPHNQLFLEPNVRPVTIAGRGKRDEPG